MARSLISKYSPHLETVSNQIFCARDLVAFGLALEVAMQYGGAVELDFERPEGASYNPRPARVALILIKDAGIKKPSVIAAALLASLDVDTFCKTDLSNKFEKDIIELASRSYENIVSLGREDSEISQQASLVAASHWFDRVRHLHQSPNLELRRTLYEATKPYIELTAPINPRLSELLDAWYKRFERLLP